MINPSKSFNRAARAAKKAGGWDGLIQLQIERTRKKIEAEHYTKMKEDLLLPVTISRSKCYIVFHPHIWVPQIEFALRPSEAFSQAQHHFLAYWPMWPTTRSDLKCIQLNEDPSREFSPHNRVRRVLETLSKRVGSGEPVGHTRYQEMMVQFMELYCEPGRPRDEMLELEMGTKRDRYVVDEATRRTLTKFGGSGKALPSKTGKRVYGAECTSCGETCYASKPGQFLGLCGPCLNR